MRAASTTTSASVAMKGTIVIPRRQSSSRPTTEQGIIARYTHWPRRTPGSQRSSMTVSVSWLRSSSMTPSAWPTRNVATSGVRLRWSPTYSRPISLASVSICDSSPGSMPCRRKWACCGVERLRAVGVVHADGSPLVGGVTAARQDGDPSRGRQQRRLLEAEHVPADPGQYNGEGGHGHRRHGGQRRAGTTTTPDHGQRSGEERDEQGGLGARERRQPDEHAERDGLRPAWRRPPRERCEQDAADHEEVQTLGHAHHVGQPEVGDRRDSASGHHRSAPTGEAPRKHGEHDDRARPEQRAPDAELGGRLHAEHGAGGERHRVERRVGSAGAGLVRRDPLSQLGRRDERVAVGEGVRLRRVVSASPRWIQQPSSLLPDSHVGWAAKITSRRMATATAAASPTSAQVRRSWPHARQGVGTCARSSRIRCNVQAHPVPGGLANVGARWHPTATCPRTCRACRRGGSVAAMPSSDWACWPCCWPVVRPSPRSPGTRPPSPTPAAPRWSTRQATTSTEARARSADRREEGSGCP